MYKIAGLICRNFSFTHSRVDSEGNLKDWFEKHNTIAISDVDTRAVVKHIRDKGAMNCVISSDNLDIDDLKAKLPFDKTNLDVKIVDDMQPYRTRKVRILNGAHTAMVPFSILYGNKTVKQSVDDSFTGPFIQNAVFNEIIDTLDMDRNELKSFADEIFDRFRNPFIIHNLSSIALNTVSKFKVRVLPSLLGYIDVHGKVPTSLTFAFASLIRFYKGTYNGVDLPVQDSDDIVAYFSEIWESSDYLEIANSVLSQIEYWGEDLTKVENLSDAVALALKEIEAKGIEEGFAAYCKQF